MKILVKNLIENIDRRIIELDKLKSVSQITHAEEGRGKLRGLTAKKKVTFVELSRQQKELVDDLTQLATFRDEKLNTKIRDYAACLERYFIKGHTVVRDDDKAIIQQLKTDQSLRAPSPARVPMQASIGASVQRETISPAKISISSLAWANKLPNELTHARGGQTKPVYCEEVNSKAKLKATKESWAKCDLFGKIFLSIAFGIGGSVCLSLLNNLEKIPYYNPKSDQLTLPLLIAAGSCFMGSALLVVNIGKNELKSARKAHSKSVPHRC